MNSSKFKANPYNKNNFLISETDVINIMKKLNIDNFKINDIKLYQKAFSHKSYCHMKDYEEYKNDINALPLRHESYEKIEFLGDSILGYIICDYIFNRYSIIYNQDEGFLTKLKNRLVCGEMLQKLASDINFNKYLLISKHIQDNCNGRNNKNILEDSLESFIGAIYLDTNNIEIVKTFIINLFEKYIDFGNIIITDTNYKDQVLRYFHNVFNENPIYKISEKDNIFKCILFKLDTEISRGEGDSKKKAEQDASKNALIKYGVLN